MLEKIEHKVLKIESFDDVKHLNNWVGKSIRGDDSYENNMQIIVLNRKNKIV